MSAAARGTGRGTGRGAAGAAAGGAGTGAAAAASRYRIDMGVMLIEAGGQGDFHVRKGFKVFDGAGREVNTGLIVQLVRKRTRANVLNEAGAEVTLTTGAEIAAFTSNQVEYMDFDYIEAFRYQPATRTEAAGWERDQFQSGAVAKYYKRGSAYYPYLKKLSRAADRPYLTSGDILMTGNLIYIPDAALAIATGAMSESRGAHPANGLLVCPNTTYWPALQALNAATPRLHTVSISWPLSTAAKASSSIVTSWFDTDREHQLVVEGIANYEDAGANAMFGGGRRRTRRCTRRRKSEYKT